MAYRKLIETETELVLCHNDLHGSNLIVDEEGTLKGIVDFDELILAPRYVEFGKMHHFSSDFVKDVIEAYEEDPFKRAALLQASVVESLGRNLSNYLKVIPSNDSRIISYVKNVLTEFISRPLVISILNKL